MSTLSPSARTEVLKQIFNPAFGGGDFYTALSSTTLPSGSTYYIQDNGIGGLFEVNTSSPTINTSGQLSTSIVNGNVALWLFSGGHRWRFSPILDDLLNSILLENGAFILQEDGTKVTLE